MQEELALIQAIRASNAPKFLPADLPLFNAIISDLFPGIKLSSLSYDDLSSAIVAALKEKSLQHVPGQIEKIIQLYETLKTRHGVMLVGPSGAGKTTIYKVLASALALDSKNPRIVQTQVI